MSLRHRIRRSVPDSAVRRLRRLRYRETLDLSRMATRRPARGAEPRIVTDFDAHAERRRVAAAVMAALDAHGVPFVALPARHGQIRQIAIDLAWRGFALVALERELGEWAQEVTGSTRGKAKMLRIHRPVVTADGVLLADEELACEVTFWPAAGTPPERHLAPTVNGLTEGISRPTWELATSSPSRWIDDPVPPQPFEVAAPLDLVYTWVDGEDLAWQARRAAYRPDERLNPTAASPSRWVSRDELRYSLRSVAMYARWVRRIYIVTDQQVPPWLDVSHPQIEVVDHRDIFTDPSVLPVFNSHAIESQLHHIDGLSEQYLYLNDDVLIGRPVEPELFFHRNGLAKLFLSSNTLDLDPPSADDLPAMSAAKNNRALLDQDFGVRVRRKIQHGVHPQLRSVLVEIEKRHPDDFERVAAARFRHPADIAVASNLFHWYAYLAGYSVPDRVDYAYVDVAKRDAPRRLDAVLRTRPQVFCINEVDGPKVAEHRDVLDQFFQAYFPLPSPYEKAPYENG